MLKISHNKYFFVAYQGEEHTVKKKEREELGVELYGVQQELARQQMTLEKEHDRLNEGEQIRKKIEMLLNENKTRYNQTQRDFEQQRKRSELSFPFELLKGIFREREFQICKHLYDISLMIKCFIMQCF